jgi:transcriptional regulator with XRE-family HTH domain
MGDQDARAGVIAKRLDHLITTLHEPGRRPYSLREIARGINEAAGEQLISVQYLSALRRGNRAVPSFRILQAIADWFHIDVSYFSDDLSASRVDSQSEVFQALQDADVRAVALRASGLSAATLAAVKALMEDARKNQGLPEITDVPLSAIRMTENCLAVNPGVCCS